MPDPANIKLIICDMDGTLLDSRSRLPAGTFKSSPLKTGCNFPS